MLWQTMIETPLSRRSQSCSAKGGIQPTNSAYQLTSKAMLMFPNPFPSGMKMTPEVAPLGPFPLVAGTGFEPATSGL